MLIFRNISHQIIAALRDTRLFSHVLLIEGARQVGKTTAVEMALKELGASFSCNLETDRILRDEIDRTESFEDFRKLLMGRFAAQEIDPEYIFIDEAQESQRIGTYIRSLKESWSQKRFIISGSSMKRLFRDDTRVPVGRVVRLRVNPFSFREFLLAHKQQVLLELLDDFPNLPAEKFTESISPLFHDKLLEYEDLYLKVGGLPEVVLAHANNANFRQLRRSILLSQKDDFMRKEPFEQAYLFMDGLRAVASFLGSVSKTTHVCPKYEDARKILEVLEQWHLIELVEQKGNSVQNSFFPKRYMYDLGIAQEVRSMPFPELSMLHTNDEVLRSQLGGLVENRVLLSLMDESAWQSAVSGWRRNDKRNSEVDFVWRNANSIPIEVKAKLKVTPRVFTNIRHYLNFSHQKVGFVVSLAPFEVFRDGARFLVNIPVYLADAKSIERVNEVLSER